MFKFVYWGYVGEDLWKFLMFGYVWLYEEDDFVGVEFDGKVGDGYIEGFLC